MKESEKKIYFMLAAGIFIISFAAILINLADAPPMIIAFYRMFFSALILTPIFLVKYREKAKLFLDYRPVIVGFFLAIHFILWITAFEYTNVANAVIFVAMQPLFTLLLEFLFAKEDLRQGVVIGVIFALVGSIIISMGDINMLFSKIWGDLLALAASVFAALYLFIGRSLRRKVDYFPYIYIVYTYAALFLGLFVLIRGLPFQGYGQINYLYFLGLALGPTLIGHSVLNYSVRFVPTTIVSLSILGEPIFTTILAWWILGEGITMVTLIGGSFILGGIYLSVTRKGKTDSKVEEGEVIINE
ncbi:MAG TPA: DMT family transporter [Halanaerobiales bacterium]|nr:DMT family transporter [Halanaerobiales bacterium]